MGASADVTGKGHAALSARRLQFPPVKLSTATFIALVDTDEGESENVTPAKELSLCDNS